MFSHYVKMHSEVLLYSHLGLLTTCTLDLKCVQTYNSLHLLNTDRLYPDPRTFVCSTRWRTVGLIWAAYFLLYMHRVNLSLAVVCMVDLDAVEHGEHAGNVTSLNNSNNSIDTVNYILVHNSSKDLVEYQVVMNSSHTEDSLSCLVVRGTSKVCV